MLNMPVFVKVPAIQLKNNELKLQLFT